jgi:hypothetical protein
MEDNCGWLCGFVVEIKCTPLLNSSQLNIGLWLTPGRRSLDKTMPPPPIRAAIVPPEEDPYGFRILSVDHNREDKKLQPNAHKRQ